MMVESENEAFDRFALGRELAEAHDAPQSFRELAKGLRILLIAFLGYSLGGPIILYGVFVETILKQRDGPLHPLDSRMMMAGALVVIGAAILSWWGRSKCLSFNLPVSWGSLLTLSMACESLAIVARFLGRRLGLGAAASGMILPLQAISWFAFWIFLLRLSHLLQRNGLIQLARANLVTWSISLTAILFMSIQRLIPLNVSPMLMLGVLAIAVLFTISGALLNLGLLLGLTLALPRYADDLQAFMDEQTDSDTLDAFR